MTDQANDSRFNGVVYFNGNTTIGGFFHDADDVSLRLTGKRNGTDGRFRLVDEDGEEVGAGTFGKPNWERKHPKSPVATGRLTCRGQTIRIAGWINEVNGVKALSIKEDGRSDTIDPTDLFV